MAKKTNKSGLMGKLGAAGKKAVNEHKSDETTFGGGGDLPPGIDQGIAQLADCKFDTYKKGDNVGEYYFYAAGIVKEPKTHGGLKIEGQRTSIMEPVCDTPNRSRETVGDHIEWILNEIRKLGIDTADLNAEDLEAVAATLKEEQPHFGFRTWQGDATKQYPSPRVNHQWRGMVEYEDVESDDVVDETEEEEEEEEEEAAVELTELDGAAADDDDADAQAAITTAAEEAGIDPDEYDTWTALVGAINGDDSEEEEEEETEEEEEAEEEDDSDDSDISVQDLGVLADDDDEESQSTLTELAGEADLDPDEYETWTALSEALVAARTGGDDDDAEDDDADFKPEKEEVYFFKPPKARKAIEVEVTAVFAGKKTCNLKSLDDDKVFKAIAWDKLSAE